MIRNYFKIAWRNLWLHKRMALINIAGLGIGMAATVLIVIWVQNELSYDRAEPQADNIYRIKAKINISKTEDWLWETSQYILGDAASKQIPEVETVTRLKPVTYAPMVIHNGDNIISEKNAAYIDAQWFNVFHYEFIEGSAGDFNKNPFSLILTETTAKKYFGNQDAMGKVLRIDTNNYQVRGVIKHVPSNSSFQYGVLIPIDAQLSNADEKKNALEWGNYNYLTFLKLRPHTSTKLVAKKLDNLLAQNKKDDKSKNHYSLVNVKDMHFENDLMSSSFLHGSHTIVNIFIALGILLLVTACINYVNLTTARASVRSKEVSIRKIVGAGRMHLFGQFMSESFLVSFFALVLAIVLVQASLPWFRAFTDKSFLQPLASPVIWGIIASTLLVSFILNGLYPAVLLSSFNPLKVFKGKAMLNFKDAGIRKMLVVVQFTISVVLIIGTLVIYNQLQYAQKLDPGYSRAQVFTFTYPWWKIKGFNFKNHAEKLKSVKEELRAQAATSNVALGGPGLVDFGNSSAGSLDWTGRPKDFNPTMAPLDADADFQQLMHITVKEGRWFNTEKNDEHNVLLNETAVTVLHLPKPLLGQRLMHNGDTGVVVGVVKDFHYKSLHDKIGPMIISDHAGSGFYIKAAPGNTTAAIAAATKIWKESFPDEPFTYTFLDETYENLYKTERQSSVLITLFAVIAILVSALGLLGLAEFAAEQKVKEIGIRKVLGASVQHIVALLSADFVKMVVIASFVAFPIAWFAMNKWLQNFAYRIDLSWWIFAASGGMVLLIALAIVSYQSLKAALANPVKSLRSE